MVQHQPEWCPTRTAHCPRGLVRSHSGCSWLFASLARCSDVDVCSSNSDRSVHPGLGHQRCWRSLPSKPIVHRWTWKLSSWLDWEIWPPADRRWRRWTSSSCCHWSTTLDTVSNWCALDLHRAWWSSMSSDRATTGSIHRGHSEHYGTSSMWTGSTSWTMNLNCCLSLAVVVVWTFSICLWPRREMEISVSTDVNFYGTCSTLSL